VGLHIHSPICLHGVVLNLLSTAKILLLNVHSFVVCRHVSGKLVCATREGKLQNPNVQYKTIVRHLIIIK
jgi:hypothetical protein